MRVGSVTQAPILPSQMTSIDQVRENLEALAKQHNTDVAGLLKSAHAAQDSPLPYQVRALNLEARLAKLEKADG